MRHAGTEPIETERLVLRRLMPEDAPAMYKNWASDPAVTRWLRWEPHKDVFETCALLAAWAELYQNPDYYQWAITEKGRDEVIGSISLMRAQAPDFHPDEWTGVDLSDGIWEPGYCLGRAWWGKGIMTEALRAVVDYWFTRTDGSWLTCCHAKGNPASGAVMRKAGFVYDHEAQYHKFDGTPVDCLVYRLTRAEYQDFCRKEQL